MSEYDELKKRVEELAKILQGSELYIDHTEQANKKIWVTSDGDKISYKDLEDSHLDAILIKFEKNEFNKNRLVYHEGLIQEKLRRTTKAGKVLYD